MDVSGKRRVISVSTPHKPTKRGSCEPSLFSEEDRKARAKLQESSSSSSSESDDEREAKQTNNKHKSNNHNNNTQKPSRPQLPLGRKLSNMMAAEEMKQHNNHRQEEHNASRHFYFRRADCEESKQQRQPPPPPAIASPAASKLMQRMTKVGGFTSPAAMLNRSMSRLTSPKLTITTQKSPPSNGKKSNNDDNNDKERGEVEKFSAMHLKRREEPEVKIPSIFDFLPNKNQQEQPQHGGGVGVSKGDNKQEGEGWVRKPLVKTPTNRRSRVRGGGG